MTHRDDDLDYLSDLLNGIDRELDAMTLPEFDGYVAGLIVCPDMVMPSEWLPLVWGDEGPGAFETIDDIEEATNAIMGHYNRVAQVLASNPNEYEPLFGLDPNSDDLLWEPWISGYERAMRLRPDAWEQIVECEDEEASATINMIIAMSQIDDGTTELDEDAIDDIDRIGPELIPQFVRTLSTWAKSQHTQSADDAGSTFANFARSTGTFHGRKVGRNEPCPCGSGRKYKKCCGTN